MSQEIKGTIADILNVCEEFNERIFPQDETGKMLSQEVIADLSRFFVFLTLADGVLTSDELAYVNDIFDTSYTTDDLQRFAEEEQAEDEASVMTVPLSLTYFIRIDNLIYSEQGIITNHTGSLIELYRKAGMEFSCCDGDLAIEELNLYNQYIAMLEEYARSGLEVEENNKQ